MSYTFRFKGIEVTCGSLDELRAAIEGLSEGEGDSAPHSGSGSKPPPPPSRPRQRKPSPRGIADGTYLKYAWRAVRSLLATNSEVGKLRSTLAQELGINRIMTGALIERLLQEQPPFLHVHETARGMSPYVRLTNREAAESFATAQERLYKEQLEAELKT